ncbi:tartrate dehydrogenase [Pseudomonas sp. C27(2019)]|uniref:tartrate dehydrogenase n=1 Tax=Pseudomonas sp. C27(2019) TaxID=2604941 RepID=UPI001248E9EA|nr:tartrate dehydrogenase [Pseudomonas sp. C27(2019)]QEY60189.1 tartrate dehydrogenase [Pseudomonas sp. C27(2019)]
MKSYNIAVIPGDGVGVEVTKATLDVLQAAASKFSFELAPTHYEWGCEYYLIHGQMMPDDGLAQLGKSDAIFLGAVGWPECVPDSVSLHGLLLPIRKQFDQFVNIRPHRLLKGTAGPLKKTDFDILCIRENTEGEYSGAGGRVHVGSPHEVAVETSVFTRQGVERILRFGFEQAQKRSGKLASVTKSNAQKFSMVFWDEVTDELAAEYPDVKVERYHVDAAAARMVTHPESFDVIVASNLFGDILSDIGAAIQGGLGFAASANINPTRNMPSMFEPVHGSAPDIAGQGKANPVAAIWSGAMMLEHLGEQQAANAIMQALDKALCDTQCCTPDMGGSATTAELAEAIVKLL